MHYPDASPESLADQMTAQQRLQSFEIKPVPAWVDAAVMVTCLILVALMLHYVEQIETFLMWVGL